MKKTVGKFKEKRKGYDKKEVDAYIENLQRQQRETVDELKEKLDDLASENLELKKAVQNYKDKEKSVSEALLLAGQKAEEQERFLYNKLKNEEARLKAFSTRWISFMNEQNSSKDVFQKRYQIEEYLKCADEELIAEINKHFTYLPPLSAQEAQFISESKRLGRLSSQSNVFDCEE